MRAGLLGTKGDQGVVEPVTVVKAGPCTVLQVKNERKDGYQALQLGFGDVKPHRSTKPMIGHSAKAGAGPKRFIREIRLAQEVRHEPGDVLTVEQFAEGKVRYVDVTGVTKGRGFSGVMKRHGFGGLPASHGVERKHRSPGSIGGHADSGKSRGVKKGKRMAGQQGDDRVTVSSLKLIKVDVENDLLLIRGSIPGPNGALLVVRQSKKKG
jgi:large subunit ribosomal protein L3